MRPGGGLRVVLHGERRDVEGTQTFDHLVVEPDMADLDPAVALGAVERALDRGLHGEPVVVRGDLHAAGRFVQHRLVDAAVPERQLVRAEAQGASEQLVAEADAEIRQPGIEDLAEHGDLCIRGGGIAGAVGVE
ncbi:hypothetical protein ABE10_03800, partial [Bacillus toyonensis]|nr:hypothetical protein [Bacillus toyonensis]